MAVKGSSAGTVAVVDTTTDAAPAQGDRTKPPSITATTATTAIVTPAPASASAPTPRQPTVPLAVFAQTSGVHPLRLVGFVRKMRGQVPVRRTVLEWRAAYDAYLQAPVK